MSLEPVDRAAVVVWRWEALLVSTVVYVAGVTLLVTRAPTIVAAIAAPALFILLLAWIAWYPGAKYRHLGWRLDADGIVIHAGVFWRTQSSLARVRIQHTDVYQGPLQRHYGIATLKLYTAGSHYSRIELPGLSHSTATRLRDELQGGKDDDAV